MTLFNRDFNSAPAGIENSGNAVADLFARVFAANQARLDRERQEEQDARQAEQDAQLKEERALRLEEAKEARKQAQFERARAAEAMRPGTTEIQMPAVNVDLTPGPDEFDPELGISTRPQGTPDSLQLTPATTMKAPRPQATFAFGDTEVPLWNRDQIEAEDRRKKLISGEFIDTKDPNVKAALDGLPVGLRSLVLLGQTPEGLIPRTGLAGAAAALAKTPTTLSPRDRMMTVPGGYREWNEERGAWGPFVRTQAPSAGSGPSADAFSPEDLDSFPEDWRDVGEDTKIDMDYSSRGGQRALARDAAKRFGRVLPDKKGKEEAQTAQDALATAKRLRAMLDAPADPKNPNGPKVGDFFGPAEGRLASWGQAGWFGEGGKPPAAVTRARAALGKFSAKDRHELFGAALTRIESQFAAEFEPSLNYPASTIQAQLDAYANAIERGMDERWYGRSAPTAPNTPSDVDRSSGPGAGAGAGAATGPKRGDRKTARNGMRLVFDGTGWIPEGR